MKIAKYCICCNSQKLVSNPAVLMPFISDRIYNWKPTLITKQWKLNTIKSGMAYSLCNSLLCLNCHLLFLDMRFDDDELGRLYYNYRDKYYSNLRNKYEPGYISINRIQNLSINFIEKIETFLNPFFKTPIKILDYGGDNGKNTPFKKDSNIIHIYDINKKVPIKGLKKVNKKNMFKKYDLIILSHVIEHVSYPKVIIKEIKKLMNQDSILYIELPLEKILKTTWKKKGGARASKKEILKCFNNKKHWHEHINFYSRKSLVKLINNCSLKIVKMEILQVESYKSVDVIQMVCKKI
jgi:hypothetical protein